jgi:hypothetical protein
MSSRALRGLTALGLATAAAVGLGTVTATAAGPVDHTNCEYYALTSGQYALLETCITVTTDGGQPVALTTSLRSLLGNLTYCGGINVMYIFGVLAGFDGTSVTDTAATGCVTLTAQKQALRTALPANFPPQSHVVTTYILGADWRSLGPTARIRYS